MRQEITRTWWDFHRHRYSLVTAQYVIDRANAGNALLAAERSAHLRSIPLLPIGDAIDRVATEIISRLILPDDFELPFPVICTPKDMMDEYENEIST